MPKELRDELAEMESWALTNKKDARMDAWKFWVLKIPAIVLSAGSGVFTYLQLQLIPILCAAIASLCALVDGLNPRGLLRNVHLRAVHDLRNLEHDMVARWRTGVLSGTNVDRLAAEIIQNAQTERKRIAQYLAGAETALGAKRETSPAVVDPTAQ